MKNKCLFLFSLKCKISKTFVDFEEILRNNFSKIVQSFSILWEKKCENNLFLENNQLPPAFASVLHIFSRKFSAKQIFPRKSANVSCHQNIFTRMVPLFLMLRTNLTFFVITLHVNIYYLRIFLQEIFEKMRKWFSRKVINDFRFRNFRSNPTQHYESSSIWCKDYSPYNTVDSLAPFGYEVAHVGDGHPVFAWPEVTLTAHKRGHHYFGEIELSVGCWKECGMTRCTESGVYTLQQKVSGFPVPSRDVTCQTLPGRE